MTDSMEKSEKTRKLILGSLLITTLIFIFLIEDEEEIYPIQSVQSMQPKKNYKETELVSENNSEYLDVEQLGQRKFGRLKKRKYISLKNRLRPVFFI